MNKLILIALLALSGCGEREIGSDCQVKQISNSIMDTQILCENGDVYEKRAFGYYKIIDGGKHGNRPKD